MITPRKFIDGHNSFWATYCASLSGYVKLANSAACERYLDEAKLRHSEDRRFIVAETAFCRLVQYFNGEALDDGRAFERAKKRMSSLPGTLGDIGELSKLELDDVAHLDARTRQIVRLMGVAPQEVVPEPRFLGCGILGEAIGDLWFPNVLVEIKAVDRNFTSRDFKQVILYALLDRAAGRNRVQNVALVNPKRGVVFQVGLNDLIFEVSGRSITSLMDDFLAAVGTGGASR